MAKIYERISRMEQKLEDLDKRVDLGFEEIKKKLDDLPKKFALKWVEKCAYTGIGVLITGFITLLIYLIMKVI